MNQIKLKCSKCSREFDLSTSLGNRQSDDSTDILQYEDIKSHAGTFINGLAGHDKVCDGGLKVLEAALID